MEWEDPKLYKYVEGAQPRCDCLSWAHTIFRVTLTLPVHQDCWRQWGGRLGLNPVPHYLFNSKEETSSLIKLLCLLQS